MNLYIKVGSITNAQRGQRVLMRYGIKCQIKRLEKPAKHEGCGYVLVLPSNDENAIDLLSNNGINVLGAEYR